MEIKYPNGTKHLNRPSKQNTHFGNRGMSFEAAINETNAFYLKHNLAVIHKKPTPIQIVSVNYPNRSAAKITEAYFRQASTTDYNGIYQGYYIDFEAKTTQNKTCFPLSNLHQHQINHMKQCYEHGGICFILFWFSSLNQCYLLFYEQLNHFFTMYPHKKSLPLSYLITYGKEIKVSFAPRIPYLQVIDQYIKELS